jgi:hypothetical protein
MKTTGSVSYKGYKCTNCGEFENEFQTNHWGDIYNTWCNHCKKHTRWTCSEEVPDGYTTPEPWTTVNSLDFFLKV